MLLKKVTIHKYKSFLTEQSYDVEERITRIVGKNESGKTALLEALAKLNYFEDNAEFKFNKDLDYPRSELVKAKNANPAALTCEYELSDEDVESVEEDFGEGIISKQNFSLTAYYDNTRTTTGVKVNFKLYNEAFGTAVQISDLDSNKPIMSQLKRLNGNKSFNHYAPANYMAKNIGTLSFSKETIERFEKLFAMVNSKFA